MALRSTWDTKGMAASRALYLDVLASRTVGEPSVTMRARSQRTTSQPRGAPYPSPASRCLSITWPGPSWAVWRGGGQAPPATSLPTKYTPWPSLPARAIAHERAGAVGAPREVRQGQRFPLLDALGTGGQPLRWGPGQ